MEHLISQFCSVPDKVVDMLSKSSEFKRAALDVAKAFNLKLSLNKDATYRDFLFMNYTTNTGLPAGKLMYTRMYGRRGGSDMYYSFRSPVISKENRGLSSREQRDALKITGLISALRKNDESPTDEKVLKDIAHHGLRYAFSAVNERSLRRPTVSADSEVIVALIKHLIESDKVTVERHRDVIEQKYREYQDALEELKSAKQDTSRFVNGCTAVGCIPRSEYSDQFYIVADVAWDPKTGPVVHSYRRYATLADSPVATDAVIIRTYAQDKEFFHSDNELGLRPMDKFLSDIDVSVGFQDHGRGVWALLPKNAA